MQTEDLRTKVSVETHSLLVAAARIKGVNPEAIAREVLDRWANEQIEVVKLADTLAKGKGSRGMLREL